MEVPLDIEWESALAELLTELTEVQDAMLEVLTEKSRAMSRGDAEQMTKLQAREASLCDRLQKCHDRRSELLELAGKDSKANTSIHRLAESLSGSRRDGVQQQVRDAGMRMRLLQHQSLSNWVMAQRTLLHLSQLLEIIASGGRLQPTYGKGEPIHARGALVDKEV